MKPEVDPTVDYAFKRIFGSEATKAVLIHLLNAVLRPSAGEEVEEVEIQNPFNEKDFEQDKLTVVDIKARDRKGRWFLVEMQVAAPPTYPPRLLYYWSAVYTGQLKEGEEFDKLQPVISIAFLDSRRFPKRPAYHHVFTLRDQTGEVMLTEHLQIHFIELPKFGLTAEQLTTPLEVWCYFLKHAQELDTDSLPQTLDIPPVRQAMEVLNVMSHDTEERERYRMRLKARRDRADDERGFRQEGFEEGFDKGRGAGRDEGIKVGIDRGAVMGRIELCQELLGLPQTPRDELTQMPDEELTRLADELQQKLKARP